jgi:hypothetical protein
METGFEIVTYLLTLFLIGWERERLAEYHLGGMAVGIIIVGKPLETLLLGEWWQGEAGMAFPRPLALLIWAGAGVLLVYLLFRRPPALKPQAADGGWLLAGLLVGVLTASVLAFPMAVQNRLAGIPLPLRPTWWGFVLQPFPPEVLRQLGYAAVTEEPLFRGFLWGCLHRAGWGHPRILLVQAGLFLVAHIYYLKTQPLMFWVNIPVAALVLGGLAWRSRSIAPGMAAHAALNTLLMRLSQMVAYWLAH